MDPYFNLFHDFNYYVTGSNPLSPCLESICIAFLMYVINLSKYIRKNQRLQLEINVNIEWVFSGAGHRD